MLYIPLIENIVSLGRINITDVNNPQLMSFGKNNIVSYTNTDYVPYQVSKLMNIEVSVKPNKAKLILDIA